MTPVTYPSAPAQNIDKQQGFSLIELMVAMAIGLVVVGTVLANYLNNTSATRRTNALTQVSGDAALAMGILRNHIAMAGFAQPLSVDASGKMVLTSIGQGIVGCGGTAMTRIVTTTNGVASPPSWSCDTAAASDSLLVRYQTDSDVSPLTKTDNQPMDCMGNAISADASGTFIAENSFYIGQDSNSLPALYCRIVDSNDPSKTTSAPLVENITQMTLTYGVAASTGKDQPIIRYVAAANVGSLPDTTSRWDAVKSVRICIVVRSADAVLASPESYVACDKTIQAPTDRFIYRTFTTTVVLNNRLATL